MIWSSSHYILIIIQLINKKQQNFLDKHKKSCTFAPSFPLIPFSPILSHFVHNTSVQQHGDTRFFPGQKPQDKTTPTYGTTVIPRAAISGYSSRARLSPRRSARCRETIQMALEPARRLAFFIHGPYLCGRGGVGRRSPAVAPEADRQIGQGDQGD